MFESRTSFSYEPQRQGYDSSYWSTTVGAPFVSDGFLVISNSQCYHAADLLKGTFTFNVKVPTAPAQDDNRTWGLYNPGRGSYLYFSIADDVFSAAISDGETSTSETITWSSDWTNASTEFRIIWEAGLAKFFINGVNVVTLSGPVPHDSLALYLSNLEKSDDMLIKYIDVSNLQSFNLNEGLEDAVLELIFGSNTVRQVVGVTDVITDIQRTGP